MANTDARVLAGMLFRIPWRAASLAIVCLFSALAADASADLAADKLMAECKKATGGAALDRPEAFHEHGTFVRDGVRGTYDEYGDIRGMRTLSVHTFKDHTDRGGFDGKSVWRQGPDGVVHRIAEPSMMKDARSDAYGTIGGYFYPGRFPAVFRARGRQIVNGRAYDVVEVVPDGGSSANLWLDAASHRLSRITTDAQRNAFAEIFDYREIDGTWIAFQSRQFEPGHHLELRLISYSYEPLNAARFAAPSK